MEILSSDRESERFGVSVGRLALQPDFVLRELERQARAFDVVIVRSDAGARSVSSRLAQLATHASFSADVLSYWARDTRSAVDSRVSGGYSADMARGPAEVVELVRTTFDSYSNHYAANPLFDAESTVDGYCEWSESMLADADCSSCVLRNERSEGVAFALVDHSAPSSDIKLAGVRQGWRGEGLYSVLIGHVIADARGRDVEEIEISTQVDNTGVMRAWARMGFEPVRAVATHHLVRRELLSDTP